MPKRNSNQSTFNIISGRPSSSSDRPVHKPQLKTVPQQSTGIWGTKVRAQPVTPKRVGLRTHNSDIFFHQKAGKSTNSPRPKSASKPSDIFHQKPTAKSSRSPRPTSRQTHSDIFHTSKARPNTPSNGGAGSKRPSLQRGLKKVAVPNVKQPRKVGIRTVINGKDTTKSGGRFSTDTIPHGGKHSLDPKFVGSRKPYRRMKASTKYQTGHQSIQCTTPKKSFRKSNPLKSSVKYSIVSPPAAEKRSPIRHAPKSEVRSVKKAPVRRMEQSRVFHTPVASRSSSVASSRIQSPFPQTSTAQAAGVRNSAERIKLA